MKQPMSPDLKGPMSKAVSTPLTAGATVGTSPGGVGVDQAVQEAREKKSMKKRKRMKERDPLLVAHTTGEAEEEASTGASTRVGLEDLLATRMPSWTDQDVNLSSVGHTGGEATEDIMPRVKAMKVPHNMDTVGGVGEAEGGAEVADVAEDTSEGGRMEREAEKMRVVNLLNQHRKAMRTETSNRNSRNACQHLVCFNNSQLLCITNQLLMHLCSPFLS